MAQISALTVTVWKGMLTQSIFGYSLYEQGGVDGYGVLFGGRKVGVSKVTTVTRAGTALSDYNTAATAYRAIMRTSITIIDQMNLTWNGVIVLAVTPRPSYDPIGYIITADWEFLVQSL